MAKRAKSEGSVYFRASDKRWVATVHLGYANGKRIRKTVYADTQQEAVKQLRALLQTQDRGVLLATDKQTVAQFLTRWLTDVIKETRRPNTYQMYERAMRLHVIPFIGSIRLTRLTAQDVQAMLTRLGHAGSLSAHSIRLIRQTLNTALEQAVRWRLVPYNVVPLTTPPPQERVPETQMFLTPAQARQLLQTARGDRLEALYRVALALGLRRNEMLGLRWQDVDFEHGTLRVEMQLQYITGYPLALVPPKSASSRRTLPLTPVLVQALRDHKARQLYERMLAGSAWQTSWNVVFATPRGTPINPQSVRTHFQALLRRAGLPAMRLHDLRHSCASLLMAQGVPDRVVQEILGHASATMTRRYSHVMAQTTRDAAGLLDAVFDEEVG